MGDLATDTAVERITDENGTYRYRAELTDEWEIWGPMGGYVASIALRAAGDAAVHPRLLCDGHSPIGADSLLGWTGRLWSADRSLVASGGGQAICRPVR